jgi:hypothetical protein
MARSAADLAEAARFERAAFDGVAEMTGDMNRADLADVLAHLKYKNGSATVRIDRDAATYLHGLLTERH